MGIRTYICFDDLKYSYPSAKADTLREKAAQNSQ